MAHVATITIDHTKVAADLTDYPVLVIANGDAGWAELYNVATEGGGDIRVFKSDDVTELPREIVSFSVSAETGEIHLKYTGTLSSTVDTDIHIYADGVSGDYAVTATYGRNNVWTDYATVHHLEGNSTDSTGNGRNGTDTSITYSSQKVGKGAEFTAAGNSVIKLPAFSYTSSYSYSLWFKKTNHTATQELISKDNGSTRVFTAIANTSTGTIDLYAWLTSGVAAPPTTASHSTSTWYQFVFVLSGGSYARNLENGAQIGNSTISANASTTSFATWYGRDQYGGGRWSLEGAMDEIRLRKSALSNNWVSTEYNNQNSPSTFYSVTSEGGVIEQALTATAQASGLIVKQVRRDITATAQATASFTRQVGRAITATAQATASFVRRLGRTLQVTAQASPTLQAGLLYVTELIATAQAVTEITYKSVSVVMLQVTAQASTAIDRVFILGKTLIATASATTSIVRNSTLARTLVATASATASIVQSGLIISRELLVTASATVTYTLGKSLSTILSVTVGSVVSLLKDFGYVDKYPKNDATYEDKYPE